MQRQQSLVFHLLGTQIVRSGLGLLADGPGIGLRHKVHELLVPVEPLGVGKSKSSPPPGNTASSMPPTSVLILMPMFLNGITSPRMIWAFISYSGEYLI